MHRPCATPSLLPPPQINGRLNADIVGQSVQRLGEIFGIQVPKWAKVLIAEVSASWPLLCLLACSLLACNLCMRSAAAAGAPHACAAAAARQAALLPAAAHLWNASQT